MTKINNNNIQRNSFKKSNEIICPECQEYSY